MKHVVASKAGADIESPPTRGRGLKLKYVMLPYRQYPVAPHAGAWVETLWEARVAEKVTSPPTRGRGLKRYSSHTW